MLAPRVALLSIAAFWTFYFVIITLRSTVIEGGAPQPPLIVQRLVVSVVSAATTLLLYLVIRRSTFPTMRRNIVMAGLLAAPAAFVYATANYLIFDSHLLTQLAQLARPGCNCSHP